MDPRLQRRIQRYGWDKAAAFYERYWMGPLKPAHQALLELAALRPGERVLETAAGTGLITVPAAEAVGPAGAVLATDLSEAMVTALTAEAARRGLGQITARRMDAEALDVEDGTHDAALSALGLMYVPDPIAALGEMLRALRPGGRAVAAVWGARDRCGWAEIFPIVDRRVASEVCPMFFQLGTGDNLVYAMTQAGFTDCETRRVTTTLAYETGDDACGAAFVGGPVALAYSRFDQPTRATAHAEYLESIAEWKTEKGYRIPGEFVVARGIRA